MLCAPPGFDPGLGTRARRGNRHRRGTVATIVATAVRDIVRALGGYVTEVYEIREATRWAGPSRVPDAADGPEAD